MWYVGSCDKIQVTQFDKKWPFVENNYKVNNIFGNIHVIHSYNVNLL